MKTSPSPSAMYNFVGKLDAEGIRALLYKTIEAAKKLGTLAAGAVDGHFIIPLDGTETHKSKKPLNEKYSQVRDHRNGEREYVHKAVVASLALTTGNLVLDWEMMNGADPTKKGEAEISCAKRLLPRIKEKFPELLDIVTVDALYPNASMVNMARELDFTLVARIKDSRRKAIRETRERFDSGPENDGTFTGVKQDGKRLLVTAHWVDDFVMAGIEKPVRVVRFLEIPCGPDGKPDLTPDPETGEPAKQKEIWVIVSSNDLSIELIWKALHLRWRVENSCFHQLKTYYSTEHLFSHKGVAVSIALIMLAFNVRELYQMRYTLYNSKGQWCSKKTLTAKFRSDLDRRSIAYLFDATPKRKREVA